ncbi:hypothetical protein F8388_017886 [Cannabis sativa]|uniref:Wall-associated receptor kinase galacturonan-binding domain-containing protein n=1 Tax=Cannabis sativa TaxID=3483 RepID=A0A7J6F6F3_CANSA|nr:hypothetical protein F8388_017886 [Cannabis sativa]
MVNSPNCETKCGDVEVPYPFGIHHQNCAINKDIDKYFFLNCNTSSGSPKLIYGINLEVSSIDVEKATMNVKNFYSYDCYSKNGSLSITLSKFFTLSDSENKLFGLGCHTQAVKNNTSVVVDWVVGNQTCEQAQLNSSSSSYVCGENTDCYYSENGGGYQCQDAKIQWEGTNACAYVVCTAMKDMEIVKELALLLLL